MNSELPVYTVSDLNAEVRATLELNWSKIVVEGEITSFTCPRSGHWYFSLKDEHASLRCAMFRGQNLRTHFEPEEGMHVLIRGRLSLYEARGEYQFIAEHMQHAGEGKLLLEFNALKAKLEKEGLFAQARKRPLPTTIARIGVITSPTGAAVRDVLTVLSRRSPATQVIIYPSEVQGTSAPDKLISMLQIANQRNEVDVLLLTRGGGSLEDLWCFNDPNLIYALAASKIPVISAVGHEVDITLCDLVADVRAPTPSAGAEILSENTEEQLHKLRQIQQRLQRVQKTWLMQAQHRLDLYKEQLARFHPLTHLQQQQQRIDELTYRLHTNMQMQFERLQGQWRHLDTRLGQSSPQTKITAAQTHLNQTQKNLVRSMKAYQQQCNMRHQSGCQRLHLVSPLSTLERGFSITESKSGHIITRSKQVRTGQTLITRLATGKIYTEVTEIQHDEL